jgi:hypothetical protein
MNEAVLDGYYAASASRSSTSMANAGRVVPAGTE